jgi:hypothetical protein
VAALDGERHAAQRFHLLARKRRAVRLGQLVNVDRQVSQAAPA